MKKILLIAALVAVAFASCDKKPNPVKENPNYIQIDGGEKQEILSSVYAFADGEGYAFAVSPMNLTDRRADVMERHFDCFIPIELMDTEIDVATTNLQGKWFLVVDLYNKFLDRKRFQNDYSTTGTIKVCRDGEDSFIIDITDFTFKDGTKVTMHYEGKMDKEENFDNFMQYTAVFATYDITIEDEVINTQTTGYIQSKTSAESDGSLWTNVWFYIDEPNAFFDLYLIDPDGGAFTEGDYKGDDGSYSDLCYQLMFETDYNFDFFTENNEGTITFAKTATSVTITFNDIVGDDGVTISGTVTCDVSAPLAAAPKAPAKNRVKK